MTHAWLSGLALSCLVALAACAQTAKPPSVAAAAISPAPAAPAPKPEEAAERATEQTPVPDGPIVSAAGPRLTRSVALTQFGFGSCLQQSRPMPIMDSILTARPQLFVMMGDNVYGDVKDASMLQLRRAYYTLSQRPEWRKLRAAVPMLATWDDHDFGDNDAGAEFPYKDKAQKLFADFWDLPARAPQRTRQGVYSSAIVGPKGQRVQFILLDLRTFRSALTPTDERNAPGKERYLPSKDPEQNMLGDVQWQWLEAELKKPAELRFIVSSIQVVAEGHGWEAWRQMPVERERLYKLIAATKAKGVVFLSGDRHTASMNKLPAGVVPYPLYDVTSSSLNLAFLDSKFSDLPASVRITDIFRPENFGMMSIDWRARTLTAQIKDKTGATVQSKEVPFTEIGAK